MLRIMLNRLKPQAEKIIAEEQADFRAGRSTFSLRILCEKYLQHQQDLYHFFIDYKKTFGAALWATTKKYNISANLIRVTKNLYGKATSAVLFNSSMTNICFPYYSFSLPRNIRISFYSRPNPLPHLCIPSPCPVTKQK